jgi:hypothetical protein
MLQLVSQGQQLHDVVGQPQVVRLAL